MVDLGKFQGCLLGTLIGDCYGAPFEFGIKMKSSQVKGFLNERMNDTAASMPNLTYTDDTQMALGLANSLIEKNGFDAKDMAKNFSEDYFAKGIKNGNMGYGDSVIHVFRELKDENYQDPFGPAKKQFLGSGSLGNGGGMRVAPVPLYHCRSEEDCIELAKASANITHTHQHGYNAAILQALAIHQALHLKPGELDQYQFVENLLRKMLKIEKEMIVPKRDLDEFNKKPFCTSLKTMQKLFQNSEKPSAKEIASILGNNVTAHRSMPTALYCFLRAKDPIEEYDLSNKTDNFFLRTLAFAISVGGDTDTIGAMACSIAGAYVGIQGIPEILMKHCEDYQGITKIAEKLHELAFEN